MLTMIQIVGVTLCYLCSYSVQLGVFTDCLMTILISGKHCLFSKIISTQHWLITQSINLIIYMHTTMIIQASIAIVLSKKRNDLGY